MPESPFEAMRLVSLNRVPVDPAIDQDQSSFLEYRLTRKIDALKFVEGKKPDIFVVSKLPRKFMRGPLAALEGKPSAQRQLAFSVAVHRVERGDGSVLVPEANWLEQGMYGTQVACEEWWITVADEFGEHVVDEMGQLAIEFAKLAKGQHGPFSLPRT